MAALSPNRALSKTRRYRWASINPPHLDHSGHTSFLREDVPVYATATTAFIAKAIQDSGKSDFDRQVCYFTPRIEECLKGWKQGAYFTSGGDCQRRFCVDNKLKLSEEAEIFWDEATRRKKFVSQPLEGINKCTIICDASR